MSEPVHIEDCVGPGFAARARVEGERVQVSCEGSADMAVTESLGAFMGRVHAAAVRSNAREVLLDFAAFEFMNSSCFKAFVTLVASARSLPEGERYHLRFLTGDRYHWQKRSLHALRGLAPELVELA